MSLGNYLRRVRHELELSLRDVHRLARDKQLGAELSSGYLSMLERNEIKEPSPRILHTLSTIYDVDYIDLMRRARYIPSESVVRKRQAAFVAFKGASQLSKEQQERIQRIINFELSESRKANRRNLPRHTDG